MKIFLKVTSFYIFSVGFFVLKFAWVNLVFECSCKDDVFPKCYALPFVYKSDSLAFSMAETFYISGILLNGLVVTILLLIFDFYFVKLLKNQKFILKIYTFLQIALLLLSVYSYYISYTFVSDDRFEWKSDFNEQRKMYKAECKSYFDGIIIN